MCLLIDRKLHGVVIWSYDTKENNNGKYDINNGVILD